MSPPSEIVRIMGLRINNITFDEAVRRLSLVLTAQRDVAFLGYFVNAHAATLALDHADYHAVLRRADLLMCDGTGVRFAARMRGVKILDNLVGTDLTPGLFRANTGKGLTYYMLGATETINRRAADYAVKQFPGWRLVGRHHGFINDEGLSDQVIADISRCAPSVLLVAMGNPLQEQWLDRHVALLGGVKLCLGVGGLFEHWGAALKRAPVWVRKAGFEWLQLVMQQPARGRRYAHDIPVFLWRSVRCLRTDTAIESNDD